MTRKGDETGAFPTKTEVLDSRDKEFGQELLEIELALEKERDVKKMFTGLSSTVSPFTSIASSNSSKQSVDSGFKMNDAKYYVFNKLQQRKWQYLFLFFVVGLMIMIATLAGTAANSGHSTPFLVFFQSDHPTFSPTFGPTGYHSRAPTGIPSESPSQAPSIYDPPIKEPIQLRLYWESGYFWQESIYQTFWCAECVDCPEYRLGDGAGPLVQVNCTSAGDTSESCRPGNQLWMQSCKNKTRDYRFEFIHHYGSGFQIRAYNTQLCVATVRNKFIEMRTCDKYSDNQLFNPIQKRVKFELRPFSQRSLPMDEAVCISQAHHPKVRLACNASVFSDGSLSSHADPSESKMKWWECTYAKTMLTIQQTTGKCTLERRCSRIMMVQVTPYLVANS